MNGQNCGVKKAPSKQEMACASSKEVEVVLETLVVVMQVVLVGMTTLIVVEGPFHHHQESEIKKAKEKGKKFPRRFLSPRASALTSPAVTSLSRDAGSWAGRAYFRFRQLFTGPDQPKEMLRALTKNSNPIQHQRGAREDTQ
ncbi:hypothetical protein HPG69_019132 [Diceros bicornis minor]|uniref:Uncharacterized protein n=1 Tax=Diceros bicornis minor TaxID=77932 RepID=A0A7J7FM24_DICBM|nr:hypothetical protein HPG69_019132 [Diceros bicornis minor]